MRYRIFFFITLNPHVTAYSPNHRSALDLCHSSKPNYSLCSKSEYKHIDFRETWQNSILSGILKPFKSKIPDEETADLVSDSECDLNVNKIIKAKTDRLKSSVQKRFVRQIKSSIDDKNETFIKLDNLSLLKLDDELSNALIWFCNKYESFFNSNSLSKELEERKIDISCTFEDIGIKNVKLNMLTNNPTFAQKLHIPRLINYLSCIKSDRNNSKWITTDIPEDNTIGLFFHSSNGSGKTYSYLLPVINCECKNTTIIVPTRELAVQIFNILKPIVPDNTNPYLLIGGANIKHQIEKLKRIDYNEFNIFVSTPGRFIDLTSRKVLDIRQIFTYIFDEYDSYFLLPKNSNNFSVKDSFTSIIKTIYNLKSESSGVINLYGKKVIFCSAIDRKKQVINLINRENVEKSSLNGMQSEYITHFLVTYGHGRNKINLLKRILDINSIGKSILIFVNKQEHVEFTSKVIKDYMPNANIITLSAGDDKLIRQKSFEELQKLKVNDYNEINATATNVCITTDIASRGIDFSPFTFLINYSIPENTIIYNNRCGRLNFSGKRGVCLTLCQGALVPKFGRTVLKDLSIPIHFVEPIQGVLFKKRDQKLPYVNQL